MFSTVRRRAGAVATLGRLGCFGFLFLALPALLVGGTPRAPSMGASSPPPASVTQSCAPLQPATEGWRLSFEEGFERLDLFDGQRGRWQTHFVWGGRTIPTNQELQLYVDPGFAGASGTPLGLNPFALRGGRLVVSAWEADAATRVRVGGARYLSGLLTTAPSFQQLYGYFEIKAKLPAGPGLWPAFWLLPPAGKWPPEIDVFEVVGRDPTRLMVSVHSAASGKPKGTSTTVTVPDTSLDFHTYGVLWTADRLAWFFDGCRVAEMATPADLHDPMYMLLNLAVGGSWVGNPNEDTRFPAELQVDYIRAYALQ